MPTLDRSEVVLTEPAMTDAGNGVYKKRILYEGRFLHPANPKRFFDITPEHFSDIVRNFKEKVFDRVQMYNTHSEDPRDVAGQVVGLEEGTEPSDMKKSLYVLLKPKDESTAERMRKNEIGVSAALDNVYREHMTGQPVGTVLRHVALVGEGWIKKLGEFMPLHLADTVVYLSEDKSGAVYLGDKGGNEDKPHKHTEEDIERKPNMAETKELKDFTVQEIIADLKGRHSIDVAALQENAKVAQAIRQALKLSDTVSLADGITAAIKTVEEKAAADLKVEQDKNTKLSEEVTKKEAEAAVAALLAENKIVPAQKEHYTKLWLKDKELFEAMTKDLKKGAVPLGEKGKTEGENPAIDEAKELEHATAVLADSGVRMKGFDSDKNGKKKGEE